MKWTAAACIALVAAASPSLAQEGSAQDQKQIDREAYTGLWYEVARTPAPFEDQCDGGVTAYYEMTTEDSVRVLNRCDLPGGEVSSVEGTANTVGSGFRQLQVDFPRSPEDDGANYVIEAVGPVVDDRYAWAVVRGPGEGYGWILSRSPELAEDARQTAEQAMQDAGLDPSRLSDTEQPPQNYDPSQTSPD